MYTNNFTSRDNSFISRRRGPRFKFTFPDIDFKRIFIRIFKLLFFFVVILIIISSTLSKIYQDKIVRDITTLQETKFGIVSGIGQEGVGESTKILKDRADKVVELFKQGKIRTILVIGDANSAYGNEVEKIVNILKSNNIPDFEIIIDSDTKRLYDVCWKAKSIYKINNAILISQDFQLPRFLYLCNSLGIESIGYLADQSVYEDSRLYSINESLALLRAMLDLIFINPYRYY